MSKLKIALLCNNKMAGPAMMRMAAEGVLCGIATADKDPEVVQTFKIAAAERGVPYLCTTRDSYKEQLHQWLHDTQADAVFVMTFPWRIPAELLSMPHLGFLNFHYGLLPEMRGADPIFESIRQRMGIAGVTVHVMDKGLDTGPIVLREESSFQPEYSYGMLAAQLARIGEALCGKLISAPAPSSERAGESWNGWPLTIQDETKAKYWPKIGEAEITIQWNTMESGEIIALVRSCNPIAKGAPTTINGWKIGVCDVSEVNLQGATDAIAPGTIVCLDMQNGLIAYCKDGKGLRLDVVYTAEGLFPGYKLTYFGIGLGMAFGG